MDKLLVLMIARQTLNTSPGGDTVQINSTAKYLRLLGVKVDIKLANEDINYQDYHLIHFFNIIRPDDILPISASFNVPFVISTIFVDYSEFEKKNRTGVLKIITKVFSPDKLEYLKTIARAIKNGDKINSLYYILNGQKRSVRYVAKKAKMLLPNSDSEYQRFVKSYGVKTAYRKIPNAIDTSIFEEQTIANRNFKDHILCVGRIEGRKNQLNLIKALANTPLFLTIIGKPSPNHLSYYQECKKLIEQCSNIQIIAHLDQSELSEIYAAAKVHVLPSWFETTGLSSLEAAIMDCNIVVSAKEDTREYFGDHAFYCEPDDVESIKSAVFEAFKAKTDLALKQKIQECYTWQKAAEKTLEAYTDVMQIGKM